jgi:hypothetical protein
MIEPNVFKSFADQMVLQAQGEATEPQSKAETGMRDHGPPQPSYDLERKSVKEAGVRRALRTLIAARTSRDYQKKLRAKYDPEEKIPGSYYLSHEGIPYVHTTRDAGRATSR